MYDKPLTQRSFHQMTNLDFLFTLILKFRPLGCDQRLELIYALFQMHLCNISVILFTIKCRSLGYKELHQSQMMGKLHHVSFIYTRCLFLRLICLHF